MKHILITLAVVLLLGCDPHMDSIYLGRAEGNMIGDVSAGNIAAVKEYLDKGGNVNLQDEPGMTPLHHAVNQDWKGSHREMVKLLIDRGADVKAIDDTHHTPLHWASNKETAELLIDAGADVNAKTLSDGRYYIVLVSAQCRPRRHPKSYQTYLGLAKLLNCRRSGCECESLKREKQLCMWWRGNFQKSMLLRFVNC